MFSQRKQLQQKNFQHRRFGKRNMSINELIEVLTDIKEQIGGEQSVFFSDNALCTLHSLGNVCVEHNNLHDEDGEPYCVIEEDWLSWNM